MGFHGLGPGFGVQGYRVLDVSIVEELSWDLSIFEEFRHQRCSRL